MTRQKISRAAVKRQFDKTTRRKQPKISEKNRTTSKKASCISLLERPDGATITELQKATGWQAHSVRGFIAGTAKKMPGATLNSTKDPDGARRYHLRRAGGPER